KLRVRDGRVVIRITDIAAHFFGEEEICTRDLRKITVARIVFAEIKEPDRTADRAAEVIVAERRSDDFTFAVTRKRSRCIVKETVRVEFFIANKFEQAAMDLIRTGAGNNVYLAAAAASGFCRIK